VADCRLESRRKSLDPKRFYLKRRRKGMGNRELTYGDALTTPLTENDRERKKKRSGRPFQLGRRRRHQDGRPRQNYEGSPSSSKRKQVIVSAYHSRQRGNKSTAWPTNIKDRLHPIRIWERTVKSEEKRARTTQDRKPISSRKKNATKKN